MFFEFVMYNLKMYLLFVFKFYKFLMLSLLNWMMIKFVKVFGVFMLFESRLAKKFAGSISEIFEIINVKLLMYECVCMVVMGMMS